MFQHRSSVSKDKKPFKGKSKGRRNVHKTGGETKASVKKIGVIGKNDRVNKAKQLQKAKREAVLLAKRLGTDQGPAKIVALIPISPRVELVNPLSYFQAVCEDDSLVRPSNPRLTILKASSTRPKQKIIAYAAPRNTNAILDIAKVADVLLLVVTPNEDGSDIELDEYAWQLTSNIKAQGVTSTLGLMQGLSDLPQAKKQYFQNQCARFFQTSLEIKRKPMGIDSNEDANHCVRMLATLKLTGLSWRSDRSYLLAETVEIRVNEDQKTASVRVAGHLRGKARLAANNLIHATGFGDYQIEQIDLITQTRHPKRKKADISMDEGPVFSVDIHSRPDEKQESLVSLKPLDETNREQSLITNEELQIPMQRDVPGSLLKYQAIWDDIQLSDDEDNKAQDDLTQSVAPELIDNQMDEDLDNDPNFQPNRVGHGLDSLSAGLNRKPAGPLTLEQKKKLAADELEWPDEVDTPMDQDARVRFQRYRGMKSFANTAWDPKENLPIEYGHLSQFEDFAAAAKRVVREAAEQENGLGSGAHVVVQLGAVPVEAAQKMVQMQDPLLLWALFQHERQVSILHCRVRRHQEDEDPVKGKDWMTVHMGFRRFNTRPIFSRDTARGDRAITHRFFHPGARAVASFYGNIYFPPAPVLMFRMLSAEAEANMLLENTEGKFQPMLASGSLMSVNPDRLNVKRIVLTGNPVDIHKNTGVCRYMFFNPEDIKYFKPVELRTKFGLNGHIVEPRGTKGLMRCRFDGHLKASDTICMNLYKRQYPKWIPEQFE